MNKQWGIGGQFLVTSFPIKALDISDYDLFPEGTDYKLFTDASGYLTIALGPYYNLELSDKWSLTAKALIGYTIGAQGEIAMRDINKSSIENIILLKYQPKNTIQYTPGISLNYHITDNLAITAYSDFSHSRVNNKYTYNRNYIEIKSNESEIEYEKSDFNYVSLGFRLTAFF